mgnify:CR=1 FL=1
MRKISHNAAMAFVRNNNYKCDSTEVVTHYREHMTTMYLHGNTIAVKTGERVTVTLAGYGTPTTRERVNGLLTVLADEFNWPHSCGFTQAKGEQVFTVFAPNGEILRRIPVSSRDVIELDLTTGYRRVD